MPSTSLLLHSPNFEAAPGRALARGLGQSSRGPGRCRPARPCCASPRPRGFRGVIFNSFPCF